LASVEDNPKDIEEIEKKLEITEEECKIEKKLEEEEIKIIIDIPDDSDDDEEEPEAEKYIPKPIIDFYNVGTLSFFDLCI